MTKPRTVGLLLMSLLLFLLASNSPALAASSGDGPPLSPVPCIVTLDGKTQNIHPIYMNQKGESMVSLADAVFLFSCNIQFQADGTVLVNHLDITQSFLPQEYIATTPQDILTPRDHLDSIYVPLRRLALDFGWVVLYKSQGPVIALQNPTYQEPTDASSADRPLLAPLPCIVKLDGIIQNIHPIYLNQKGESMVSLADAVLLFSCNIRFQTDGSVLVNHLDISQSFLPPEYISTAPIEILTPSEHLDSIYLPLRRLAQDFGWVVVYKSQGPVISVQNPTYQEPYEDLPIITVDKEIIPVPPDNLPTWGIMGPELRSRWPNATFISSYYTTLINSPEGRTHNIILASAKINSTILESGEVFSFNTVVGQRTLALDYQEAKIFVGDEIVQGVGGGICQVSSTLYNTALEAGMQIVERHPHTLPVTYCPPGQDATVSWGSADLKFRNTLNRPLQILCCVYGPYVLTAFVEVY